MPVEWDEARFIHAMVGALRERPAEWLTFILATEINDEK
jgi:hypothetical protein